MGLERSCGAEGGGAKIRAHPSCPFRRQDAGQPSRGLPLHFLRGTAAVVKTILYIDGFNLYYSALKGTPLRWLNPTDLAAHVFPRNQIVATKFFSALWVC